MIGEKKVTPIINSDTVMGKTKFLGVIFDNN